MTSTDAVWFATGPRPNDAHLREAMEEHGYLGVFWQQGRRWLAKRDGNPTGPVFSIYPSAEPPWIVRWPVRKSPAA
jgi:hypothetical protein